METSNEDKDALVGKCYLVTGGAGFIGVNLIDSLLKRDASATVICMDNYMSSAKSDIESLKTKYGGVRLRLLCHNVIEPLVEPFKALKIDRIYHLACPASPVHYQTDAIMTLKTGFLGTLNVLDLAKELNARMVISSTSEVYGDPLEHPQKETYFGNVNICGIRSCYDEGKRAAEALATCYFRQHAVDVRIARIFNTFGPHMSPNDGRVVSNFICQSLADKPITVYGNGTQTRSFCYIDDMIEGLQRLMDFEYSSLSPEDTESLTETASGSSADGASAHRPFLGPVNLGNPVEKTVGELAEAVATATAAHRATSPSIVYLPIPADDPCRRKPDISKAKKYLGGWEPTVPLESGLKHTVEYFKHHAIVCHTVYHTQLSTIHTHESSVIRGLFCQTDPRLKNAVESYEETLRRLPTPPRALPSTATDDSEHSGSKPGSGVKGN